MLKMKIPYRRELSSQIACLFVLFAFTNVNGAEMTMIYDGAGQVQRIDYQDNAFIQFDYDGAGNRIFHEVDGTGIQELVIIPQDPSGQFPGGVTGGNYSETLVASGGQPPYDWSIVAGSLPQGLTLNESSGLISGSPAESGTFDLMVQVSDSLGNRGFDSISIEIKNLNWLPGVLMLLVDS